MNNGDKLAALLDDVETTMTVEDAEKEDFEAQLQEVHLTNQGLAMQYCQMQCMFSQLPEEELHQQLEEAFGLPRAGSKEEALAAFNNSPQISAMMAGLRKINAILDRAFEVTGNADKFRLKSDSSEKEVLGVAVERAISYVQTLPGDTKDMMMEMMGPFVEPYRLQQ